MKNEYEVRGEITAIFLTSPKHGQMETLINTSDLDRLQEFNGTWRADWNGCTRSFYVKGHMRKPDGKQTSVYMHRWILKITNRKKYVDHINRDTLDNTRNNLNEVTPAENQQNKRKLRTNSSGYTGVSWNKQREKWAVRIIVNNEIKNLGLFNDINDAIAARKDAEILYYEYKQRIN